MLGFIRALGFAVLAMVLVSCGGGGGSPGTPATGGVGTPVTTDTLTLSQGTLNYSATQFEAIPAPITVTARITGSKTAGIIFGTLPGVEDLPFWLNVELGSLENNSVDAVFNITTTDLPGGDYNFTVRAVTFDASENVLDTADVRINFSVAVGVPISVAPENIDVVMHYASDPITEVFSVTAGDYEWSAFSSDGNVTPDTGTGPQDVSLEIFPPMKDIVDADGRYQGLVDVFQNGSSNGGFLTLNFQMFPTLEFADNDVFLNAVSGNSETETAGVNLIGQGLNWQASSNAAWMSLSATQGEITSDDLEIGTVAGNDFSITVDASGLAAGRHDAIITVTAEAEQSIDIPVSVDVGAQILRPTRRGIALSETPATRALQTEVKIATNADRMANWAATSNVNWLSVTASGTVDDVLTITADPTMLPDEMLSKGVVTLSSPDDEISQTIDIPVGFWKSALAPSDTPARVGGMFPEDLIVSDPIRPLAYVHSGEREINIVNVYTGLVEKTIIPADRVFSFDVSDDGTSLYLIRSGGDQGFIDVVDLETQEITTTWSYASERLSSGEFQDIAFGRVSNLPYLFTSTGVIIDAETGAIEALNSGSFPSRLEVRDEVFCGGNDGQDGPVDLACFDLVSAGFEGARLSAKIRDGVISVNGKSFLTDDGGRAFVVDEGELSLFDTSSFTLIASVPTPPEDFWEQAVLDSKNNLYVTYRNDGFVPTEVDEAMVDPGRFMNIYDADLVLLRTVNYPSAGDGVLPIVSAMALSADDQRVVFLTDDELLEVNFFSLD